jgi:hypothetical protein
MRMRKLKVEISMSIESLASITAVDGPKQILDTYVGNQAAGSSVEYKYRENVRGINHLLVAVLSVVVVSRLEASTKMGQIDNNLELLPSLQRISYCYSETEKSFGPEE